MRLICPGCGKRIIASDDDAGICIYCGGRNRREEDHNFSSTLWPEAVALFTAALAIVLVLAYSCSTNADEIIQPMYPYTGISNPNAPSVTVTEDGTVYPNYQFHPYSDTPDYSLPLGEIVKPEPEIHFETEIRFHEID